MHVAGSGAQAAGLRDPRQFNRLGADLNPHKMNGRQVGQLQHVIKRSQRKMAGAGSGNQELRAGFRSPFSSDHSRLALQLIPTSWAS